MQLRAQIQDLQFREARLQPRRTQLTCASLIVDSVKVSRSENQPVRHQADLHMLGQIVPHRGDQRPTTISAQHRNPRLDRELHCC